MATDINGREYARLSQLTVGDKVQVDDGFECIPKNAIRTVRGKNRKGLFIRCAAQEHYLEGQLMDDGDSLVGIYKL